MHSFAKIVVRFIIYAYLKILNLMTEEAGLAVNEEV